MCDAGQHAPTGRSVPVPVADPNDSRILAYRAVRDRDLAGRPGRFVAEGSVVVRTLLSGRCRFRVESILVADHRLAAEAALLSAAPPDVPVYVADRAVMDGIVGFSVHRGLLAVGIREPEPEAASLLPPPGRPALVLGLVGIANHDNVGGLFRNAAAFGADAVLLDGTSCDPLYRKAIRVSVGAALTMPFRRGGSEDALVETLVAAGFEPVALGPRGRERVDRMAWPARTALLVGAEGSGLPEHLLGRLRSARIAMAPGFDSLNVATAAAIALQAARSAATDPADD